MGDATPADRLPPHSREAEAGLIGAMLRDGGVIDDAAAVVGPAEFYLDAHQKVFAAAVELHRVGRPADLVTVAELLQSRHQVADVGGAAYLADLWDAAPTAANALYYARIVREKATYRRLIHLAAELARDAHDARGDAESLIAEAEQRLFDLAAGDAARRAGEPADLAAAVRAVMAGIDERRPGAPAPYTPTGYGALDGLVGGWRPGRLYVLAARPSVGKSALALAFLLNAADRGVPGLVFSLEMGAAELAERALAVRSGVSLTRVIGGDPVTPAEAAAIAGHAPVGRVFVDDRADLKASQLASVTRRMVRRHGVGLVAVDYLQLLTPENPRDPRHLQVGADSRRLKQLARQCHVPVLCLCQLNREVEGRTDPKPKLSDLRDSGEIEQNADAVLLLYPEAGGSPGDPLQPVGCVLAKQRNGPKGEFTLNYRRPCVRFEDRVIGL